jgi:hypothetical protein
MKVSNILFLFVFTILGSGCSLNEGTENLYKQENVIQIDLDIPTEIDVDKKYTFKAIFTDQNQKVPELENIRFTIWKNGMDTKVEIVPSDEGNGVYKLDKTFTEEGLYFFKVEANTAKSKVMPTKQFTVGSLTEEDLKSLPKQDEEGLHEGHH